MNWAQMFEDMFKPKKKEKKKEIIKIVEKIVYKEKPKFEKQTGTETIDGAEAKEIVKDTLGNIVFNKADAKYKLVDIEYLKLFLKQNDVSEIKYIPNDFDCDDHSFALQGDVTKWDGHLAFGIIWGLTITGMAHAFNWCIGTDKKIWLVEPQNDLVFLPTTEKIWWVAM